MKQKEKMKVLYLGRLLFGIYLILLVYFLFFSERYGRTSIREYRYNLELFAEIRRFIKYRNLLSVESFLVNLVGNLVGFMPFGFFIPMLSKKKKFFQVLLLSFQFTLTIEMIQLFTKVGIFDVDDLFLNTVGGVLGYICYRIAYGIYHCIYHRKEVRYVKN